MTLAFAGVVEGFYGRLWTADERIELAQFCAEQGMRDWLYAPKDDPKHRADWRTPYDATELDGFRRFVSDSGLRLGFGISPGLSIDYGLDSDRAALAEKIASAIGAGASFVGLLLDDIPPRDGLGEEQAALTTWLRRELGPDVGLLLVPTDYVNVEPNDYLRALADGVPEDVPIGWTGRSVVNETLTVADAAARAAALGGRLPLVWDNYPVNDFWRDQLFLGPLRGREPGLVDRCSGWLANPMLPPRANRLPLASVAAWLQGGDPDRAWQSEADASGLRIFAEACDGDLPRALVAGVLGGGDDTALADWLDAAAACEAPGLEGEVDAFVTQIRREAEAGQAALRAVRALHTGSPDVFTEVMGALMAWMGVRKAEPVVMGERFAFRPVLGQRPDGEWRFGAGALVEDRNAIDALVRYALDRSL